MRLLIGICAVFGAILVLGSISLVIKNNRLQAQLSQRGGRTNSHNGKTKGKNIRHDQDDDSDDDFLSNLVDIGNSNDEGEDSMDGILDEDSDSNNNDDDSSWIKNDLNPENKDDSNKPGGGGGGAGNGGGIRQVSSDIANKKITISGAHGPTSYLNTLVLTINKEKPYVENKLHFNGMATLSSGQEVDLHLSSPANDPFWYITLGDTIHRASDGSNLTPVIAYTKCQDTAIKPWEPGAMCEWTVHEGKDIGWRISQNLRLRSQ